MWLYVEICILKVTKNTIASTTWAPCMSNILSPVFPIAFIDKNKMTKLCQTA